MQRALEEVRAEHNVIIQSCLSAKGGIIQSQVLSPSHMVQILRSSQESFPHDLEVPVQLSEAYTYLLINILTVDKFIL
jgi:nitrous oxidase accessory protein NosD